MIHPLVEMPHPVIMDMIVATITGLDVAEDRLFAKAIQCRGMREHIMSFGIKIQTAIIVAMEYSIIQHQMPLDIAVELAATHLPAARIPVVVFIRTVQECVAALIKMTDGEPVPIPLLGLQLGTDQSVIPVP
jgi:hypothetical protein